MTSVRRIGPDEWAAWRDLRLAALREAPDAFGSTYSREQARTEAEWRERSGHAAVRTIATVDGVDAGIAGGYESETGVVELVAMWVAPASRGRGVARVLLDDVAGWGRERGAHTLHLWVSVGNAPAERFYARHGFELTGQTERLLSNPDIPVVAMCRPLDRTVRSAT